MKKNNFIYYLIILIIGFGLYWYLDKINISNNVTTEVTDKLEISYLDVGQADSILINDHGTYMLIDAGNNEDGSKLVSYFKSLGISEFKYVVGTHAHEDHIGGMDDIINNFKIDNFYMPNAITTTATFEDVLDALDKNNVKLVTPTIDSTFTLNTALLTVLYTGTDTSNLNNTSIVLKMTYGSNNFLFMGDAPISVEKTILNKDIKADVLKVGHHGSQYSSSDAFLKKVNPTYAIISVGKNNDYGHPNEKTLSKLNNLNVKIYRTDENGTIKVISDGNSINIDTLKTDLNG
jgi:competence protein ComEC